MGNVETRRAQNMKKSVHIFALLVQVTKDTVGPNATFSCLFNFIPFFGYLHSLSNTFFVIRALLYLLYLTSLCTVKFNLYSKDHFHLQPFSTSIYAQFVNSISTDNKIQTFTTCECRDSYYRKSMVALYIVYINVVLYPDTPKPVDVDLDLCHSTVS